MKKFLMLTSVAVLILGLTAATYAMELNITGDMFHRTGWFLNVNQTELQAGPDSQLAPAVNTGFDDINARTRSRARIKFDAAASEDLHGVVFFEMGEQHWGEAGIGQWGADSVGVEIKHAYIDFKIPGTDAFPTRATVGVQDFLLGAPFALDDDGAGVELTTTAGPANIQLMWMKQAENVYWQSDDVDAYGLGVSFPVGPVTPKVWALYNMMQKDYRAVTHPAGAGSDSGYCWHFGVDVTGKVGPVALEGQFAFMNGEIDYSVPFIGAGWWGQNVLRNGEEASGFGLHFKASIPVAILEVGSEFVYTSGDDIEDIANDREYGYRMPLTNGAVVRPGVVYHGSGTNWGVSLGGAVAPTFGTAAGGPIGATAYAGDWILGVFATAKPLEWMSVTVKGLYIGDNVENGDRFGTAVDFLGLPEDNDSAGFEFDLVTTIQIYENLSYEIAAGYLFAGDALDQFDAGATAMLGINTNESPKNPWAVVSSLSYSF